MNCSLLYLLLVLLSQALCTLDFIDTADDFGNKKGRMAIIGCEYEWSKNLIRRLSSKIFTELIFSSSKIPSELLDYFQSRFIPTLLSVRVITIYNCAVPDHFLNSLDLSLLSDLQQLKLNKCQMANYNELYKFLLSNKFWFRTLNLDNNDWIVNFLASDFPNSISSAHLREISLRKCKLGHVNLFKLVNFLLLFEGLEFVDLSENNIVDSYGLVQLFVEHGGSKEVVFTFYKREREERRIVSLLKSRQLEQKARKKHYSAKN